MAKIKNIALALNMIPVDRIDIDEQVACRDFHPHSDGYKVLLDSMKRSGFNEAHPVEVLAPNSKGRFILLNGRHRFEAAKATGLKAVPAYVRKDVEVGLDAQMEGWRDNASNTAMELWEEAALVSAKREELVAQGVKKKSLKKELLAAFGKTNPNWLRVRLAFASLPQASQDAFKQGEIGVAHLDALTTPKVLAMTEEQQLKLLEKAKVTPGGIFQSYLDAESKTVAKKKAAKAAAEIDDDTEEGDDYLEAVKVRSPKALARKALKAHEVVTKASEKLGEIEANKYEDGTYDGDDAEKAMKLREQIAAATGARDALKWAIGLQSSENWVSEAELIAGVEGEDAKPAKPSKASKKDTGKVKKARTAAEQAAKDAEADED